MCVFMSTYLKLTEMSLVLQYYSMKLLVDVSEFYHQSLKLSISGLLITIYGLQRASFSRLRSFFFLIDLHQVIIYNAS